MAQSRLVTGGFVLAASLGLLVSTAWAQCCGDCNGDGEVTIDELLNAVNSALGACPGCVTRAQIPRTGQTKCWDTSGNEINCAGTGQDGELLRGARRSYTNNGDGTITDDATSLMWEVKSDDGSDHDKDNTYTWEAAFAFVRGLNQANFAGYNDWRLPNRFELESISALERATTVSPAADPAFDTGCVPGCGVTTCTCTAYGTYWSSTSLTFDPVQAWYVQFSDTTPYTTQKSHAFFVRGVRSALLPGCALGVPACTLPPR